MSADPTINLNQTTPAAPGGYVNVKWQRSGTDPVNVSAYVPSASGGGALFEADGDSLTGWTAVSGGAVAGQATSGYSPFDLLETFFDQFAQASYIDIGGSLPSSSFAGTIIEFDIASGSSAFACLGFGFSAGDGPLFVLDGRVGINKSGIGVSSATYSLSTAPSVGPVQSGGTWYHIKLVINKAGTYVTWYINGAVQTQVAITLLGTQLAFFAFNTNGGNLANLRVYSS